MATDNVFEANLASEALLAAAKRANESMATFSGWLMAASGAAFSLAVSNLEKMEKSIAPTSLRIALGLTIGTLAIGMLVKLLTTAVDAGAASHADGQKLPEKLGTLERPP